MGVDSFSLLLTLLGPSANSRTGGRGTDAQAMQSLCGRLETAGRSAALSSNRWGLALASRSRPLGPQMAAGAEARLITC